MHVSALSRRQRGRVCKEILASTPTGSSQIGWTRHWKGHHQGESTLPQKAKGRFDRQSVAASAKMGPSVAGSAVPIVPPPIHQSSSDPGADSVL